MRAGLVRSAPRESSTSTSPQPRPPDRRPEADPPGGGRPEGEGVRVHHRVEVAGELDDPVAQGVAGLVRRSRLVLPIVRGELHVATVRVHVPDADLDHAVVPVVLAEDVPGVALHLVPLVVHVLDQIVRLDRLAAVQLVVLVVGQRERVRHRKVVRRIDGPHERRHAHGVQLLRNVVALARTAIEMSANR